MRNQFFTPRYVVQFLTDNTLGRIWCEMRGGRARTLVDLCDLHGAARDVFSPRPKKDPRDIRVLDPACGSGHFLLYAFDLFDVIYEEAWNDPASPSSDSTGNTLRQDYPQPSDLRKAVPGLVLRHNLHGVDIDARCAQIAQLALWMRAQRAFGKSGIPRGQRPDDSAIEHRCNSRANVRASQNCKRSLLHSWTTRFSLTDSRLLLIE